MFKTKIKIARRIVVPIFIALFLLNLTSCSDDEDNKVESIERYINIIEDETIIPEKVAFNRDKQIVFKIKIEENYVELDLGDYLIMDTELYLNDSTIVPITFFDDGGIDPMSYDFVAQNKLWTGVVNSLDFPSEGSYLLRDSIRMLDDYGNVTNLLTLNRSIIVKENRAPVIESITGISSGDILESGFDNLELEIDVTDEDNDINSNNDSQLLYFSLLDSMDLVLKVDTVTRAELLDNFEIILDSTYAAGVKSSSFYKLQFLAEDEFNTFSNTELYENIRIENEKPIVDSVRIVRSDSLYFIRAYINDKQGNLSNEDINEVKMKFSVGTTWEDMFDNGDFSLYGDENIDDGIYSVIFNFSGVPIGTYEFEVIVSDKDGNIVDTFIESLEHE